MAPRPAPTDHFEAQRKHLENALRAKNGVRLNFEDPVSARSFRMRCYTLRKLDRANNSQIYPPGHPSHNTSAYDHLLIRVKIERTGAYVLITNIQPEPTSVSEL